MTKSRRRKVVPKKASPALRHWPIEREALNSYIDAKKAIEGRLMETTLANDAEIAKLQKASELAVNNANTSHNILYEDLKFESEVPPGVKVRLQGSRWVEQPPEETKE